MSSASLTRAQVYRRRRIAASSGLLLAAGLVAGGVYVPSAALAELPDAAPVLIAAPVAAPPAAAPAFPGFGSGAVGAVGFDGVLASSGEQGPMPMASITKVITALVVLDAEPLGAGEPGPDIRFTQADVDLYHDVLAHNGSVQPVSAGLVLTERQALEAVLVPSAGNYAESLARWAYGTEAAFLAAARTWLDARGLTETVVVEPTGISPDNRSTPANLVELGKLALAQPAVAEIVARPTATADGIGVMANTNKLLGILGVDGIKTGTTDEAGACLLFATDFTVGSRTVTLIGVVLGGPTHPTLNAGIAALIESVIPGFTEVTLTTSGRAYATYETAWGETATAVAMATETALVWSDAPVTAAVDVQPVEEAPAGAEVGAVTATAGATTVVVPLQLDREIDAPDFWWRVTNPPWERPAA
ncbi:MAG: D-alanyl-D-alanine endopeptidase [Naasia sp.]|nr:D-alanyl-D-alanine endopeptidase [Naasia sp.]